MKITSPMPNAKALDRTNAAMAPPDPMTTGLNPQGLTELGAADLEDARQADPQKPEADPDPVPPNPYRPHTD